MRPKQGEGLGCGLLLRDIALQAASAQAQQVVLGLQQPVVEAAVVFDRTQAVRRNAQAIALAHRFRHQRHVVQVRKERPLGLVVGVGNIVTHLTALAGQLANARHDT